MEVSQINFRKYSTETRARAALVRLLQNAHAGEKAAANAYFGHAHSLFIAGVSEKKEILQIYDDELHHRRRIRAMLKQLNAQPRILREIQMWLVGAVIALLSYFGTWLIPMYGAGRLERSNIGEYEVAARLAMLAGQENLVDELLHFAEVEWDHELYFLKKVQTHYLYPWLPQWEKSKPRDEIKKSFLNFREQPEVPVSAIGQTTTHPGV